MKNGDSGMTELPPAAKRVEAAARTLGLEIEIRTMPASTRTAAEAAQAVAASVGQIVKSLVFKGETTGKAHLILVSGTNRVQEPAMSEILGEPITRPDAAFVRATTGYAIGGVPPLGHAAPLVTLMDEDLLQYATIWAAAGTPYTVFAVAPWKLQRAVNAQVVRVI
jgi:prolyl-tRNA editing enzyme YbaK/EbsC (Cys-tRNA(Pro) deacylase)